MGDLESGENLPPDLAAQTDGADDIPTATGVATQTDGDEHVPMAVGVEMVIPEIVESGSESPGAPLLGPPARALSLAVVVPVVAEAVVEASSVPEAVGDAP